jgi:hypothetical protein
MATKSNEAFIKAIEAANTGKRFPALNLVSDPSMAAVMSKLITGIDPTEYGEDGNRKITAPNMQNFRTIAERTAQNASDAETVMQVLPDTELSAQILISSILSPKDMMTCELTYVLAEGLMALDVSSAMIARTKRHFEQVYKINELLPKMLRDILFEKGSYPVAVIPENAIDEIINGNHRIKMESLADSINQDGSVKPIGLLGPAVTPRQSRSAPGLSLESLADYKYKTDASGKVTFEGILCQGGVEDTFLYVTDNPDVLKIPEIHTRVREQRIMTAITGRSRNKALESFTGKLNDRTLSGKLFKERQFGYNPIASIKTQEQLTRRTIGNPLILHLPSESVIPAHVPGSPEKQVGFFILIDADGHPISKSDDVDYYQQLSNRLSSNGSFPSAMLTKVKSQMQGFDITDRNSLDYSARAYGQMVEQDLLARLRNGAYGDGVELGKQEEIYRIMFARALAKQHTQILFVPAELMTYFAFRYNNNGIGKSILDDMKILNSLRSMLLFANVMASLKNSIGRTEVKLKLDPDDPNPQKTIETAMHEIIRSRQQYFPLGMNSPTDLTDWLMRSGFEFTHEGHPGLPDVAVDFGEKSTQYVKPDTDLVEDLRKQSIMAAGLSPETVDNTFQSEFAVSVVTNNILLSKRVAQTQDLFTPLLSDHMRKVIMNSEELLTDLRKILENNFDKIIKELELTDLGKEILQSTDPAKASNQKAVRAEVIEDLLYQFIMNFSVSLPKPNSVTLDNQLKALEIYDQALEKALDAWVSDKFFTSETGGEIANQVGVIREVIKAHFLRQWMNENGVLPEMSALTTLGSDGSPSLNVFEAQQTHIQALTQTLTKFMVGLKPMILASNEILENTGVDAGNAPASSSSEDEGGGGGNEDDLFGGGNDDFSLDPAGDGEGGEETPAEGAPEGSEKEPEAAPKDEPEEKKNEEQPPAE